MGVVDSSRVSVSGMDGTEPRWAMTASRAGDIGRTEVGSAEVTQGSSTSMSGRSACECVLFGIDMFAGGSWLVGFGGTEK